MICIMQRCLLGLLETGLVVLEKNIKIWKVKAMNNNNADLRLRINLDQKGSIENSAQVNYMHNKKQLLSKLTLYAISIS